MTPDPMQSGLHPALAQQRCRRLVQLGLMFGEEQRDIIYLQSPDGTTWEKFESFIIDDEGTIIEHSQFAGKTTGSDFKRELLKINYQQIVTASAFQGRKIDLVVAPKILIESGLIP